MPDEGNAHTHAELSLSLVLVHPVDSPPGSLVATVAAPSRINIYGNLRAWALLGIS